MANVLDEVVLVDSNDIVIGKLDKYKAHEHPLKLHRAVSVWLVNDRGQVLLQKRSSKKIVGAGWWGNAICGNVRPTETNLECAHRRLNEEIGILDEKIKPIYKFIYKAYCNEKYGEYEMDEVYLGNYNKKMKLNLNPNEASEVAWVDFDDLVEQVNIGTAMSLTSPEQTLVMNLEQLKNNTAPYEIDIYKSPTKEKQLLAPWTWIMLKDERLVKEISHL